VREIPPHPSQGESVPLTRTGEVAAEGKNLFPTATSPPERRKKVVLKIKESQMIMNTITTIWRGKLATQRREKREEKRKKALVYARIG